MKLRSFVIGLVLILAPFVIGMLLYVDEKNNEAYQKINFTDDTRNNGKGVTHKGIKVDWSFCPGWNYKPLFSSSEEYLVFMFHFTNDNEASLYLTPSYTLVSPGNRFYSANEEIAMYIEDKLEDKLKVNDETAFNYNIPSNASKHYTVTFEKPEGLNQFYADVDVFRDITLRIHYTKKGKTWVNNENELVNKYKGRG